MTPNNTSRSAFESWWECCSFNSGDTKYACSEAWQAAEAALLARMPNLKKDVAKELDKMCDFTMTPEQKARELLDKFDVEILGESQPRTNEYREKLIVIFADALSDHISAREIKLPEKLSTAHLPIGDTLHWTSGYNAAIDEITKLNGLEDECKK